MATGVVGSFRIPDGRQVKLVIAYVDHKIAIRLHDAHASWFSSGIRGP